MASSKGSILVTGANGGLGLALIQGLSTGSSSLPVQHALYTVRSASAADKVRSTVAATKTHSYDILQLDLSRQTNVREIAATINKKVHDGDIPRIRAVVLNAGYRAARGQTRNEDGLDETFTSNYLGHWLLTLLILQSMDREAGRIIVVGGMVHDPNDRSNSINKAFEEEPWKRMLPNASIESVESVARGTWAASPDNPAQDPRELYAIRRYGAAKLFLIMMIPELQRRLDTDAELDNISVLGVDPGIMPTAITVGTLNWAVKLIFSLVARVASVVSPNGLIRLPHKSADDLLAAAFETGPPLGSHPKGLYFNGKILKEISDEAKDAEKRLSVWKASLQYSQLQQHETCLADWK